MKPSNTGFSNPSTKTGPGIDWLRLTTIPSRVADAISGNITEREFVTVCEWAAQFAIAKYRKELAAKVEKMLIENPVDMDFAYNSALDDLLALLNENDDEAQI